MNKTMRKLGSLLLACLLTALMLLGPVASAEKLLEAMMDIALKAGKTIEGTIRIDAGVLLAVLGMSPDGSDPTAAAVYDLLTNGLLRVRYAQAEASDIICVTLELRDEPIVSFDMRSGNGEIALETNLLPGKTLVIPSELITQSLTVQLPSAVDEDLLGALAGGLERYLTVAASWASQNEGIYSVLETPVPATQTRDAAVRSTTLRVTDEQWHALAASLAEELAKDEALLQILAPQIGMEPAELAQTVRQVADSLSATQLGVLEATLFTGEGDQVVGFDAQILAPSQLLAPGALDGSFAYGHYTITDEGLSGETEGFFGDHYEASFTWGDGNALSAQFSRRDKIPSELLPIQGVDYGGRARLTTQGSGAMELEIAGEIRHSEEPILEIYGHQFDARISQIAEGADAMAQMVQAPLLSAGFVLNSQTEAIGIDDFKSFGSFTLNLMGMEAAIHYTLESSDYVPAEHSENSVLRLDALTPEESDALTMELMQNALVLLGSMLSMPEEVDLPQEDSPALFTYQVDDETVASIDSIVGLREITSSEAGITEGKPYVLTYYAADSVLDDLQAYIDFLIGDGWAVTGMEGDASSGTVQLATESALDGMLLMITSEFTSDAYSILLHRTGGTLARYTDADGNKLGEVTLTNAAK